MPVGNVSRCPLFALLCNVTRTKMRLDSTTPHAEKCITAEQVGATDSFLRGQLCER